MRIVHVIASMEATHGGPPVIAACIASAQAQLGHEAALFSYDPGASDAVVKRLKSFPGGDRVKLHFIPRAEGREMMFGRRAGRAFNDIVRNYDFVHIHGIWEGIQRTTAAQARAAGVPYCVVPHGMLDTWSLAQSALKKKMALALLVKPCLDKAAFLHLGNVHERDVIKPLHIRSAGEIIPNGAFLEEFATLPPIGTFRNAHPEIGQDPYILFLSRLHYKKGLDYLADSFAVVAKQRQNVRLVVAGADDGYKATFEQMIAAHGLGSRTHLVGPLYGEQKLAAFNEAACFCLPSRQEGFSIAITESLACGTPAVVSEDCHYPEVEEVGAGAVTRLDANEVAKGLLRTLDANRSAMGDAGRRLVRERFNWPAVAHTTLAAYSRAYERLGRPVPGA